MPLISFRCQSPKLLYAHPLSLISLFTVLLQVSFLKPLFCLPLGVHGGGCGHARLIWHLKNMAATTPSFSLDLRGDWFCIRSSKQFIVGDDFRPKEAENSLQCSLIPTNFDNYFIFRRSRRYCPCTHQPTSMKPEYLRLWFVQLWSAAITSQILCTWWLIQRTCIPLRCLSLLQLCR